MPRRPKSTKQYLQKLISSKNTTLEQVASDTGLSMWLLRRALNGEFSEQTRSKLASHFGVSVVLFGAPSVSSPGRPKMAQVKVSSPSNAPQLPALKVPTTMKIGDPLAQQQHVALSGVKRRGRGRPPKQKDFVNEIDEIVSREVQSRLTAAKSAALKAFSETLGV